MVRVQDWSDEMESLGREYFIAEVRYVPDMRSWAKQNRIALNEPAQPMKLITGEGGGLVMVVQAEVSEKVLDEIITGLDMRWQVVDNSANLPERFDSTEKKLAYCFLKEYARNESNLAGDERLEDEWAMREMERLGFFEQQVARP